jgi:sporulation protein YqfC
MAGGKTGFLNHISDLMELPKDVILNVPKVVILGNIQVLIENHSGIIEYTLESVKVNSPIGIIEVKGSRLAIKSIVEEEIIIDGTIDAVVMNGQGGRP